MEQRTCAGRGVKCWLNGVFRPVEEARIAPNDRGFLLGDGIFETLLAEGGAVRHAGAHLARLSSAAKMLGIPEIFPAAEIAAAMVRLLQENQLMQGRAALRLTLTRGEGARGVAPPADARPTLLLTAGAIPPPPASMRAIVSTYIRNEKSVSSRIKSLNYLDNIMARSEAVARYADEALMCNSMGHLASASAANLFIVTGGELRTPSMEEGALPGIMRAIVLQAAAVQQIAVRVGGISMAELSKASEAFLTNALTGVCPLVEIDGRPVGDGSEGPLTRRLKG